jgi:hypothetical protein
MGAEFAKTNFFFYSLRVTRSSSSIDRKAHCEGACLVVLRLKSFHDKLERAVLEFYAKCVQALKDLGRKIHNRRGPGDGIKILLSQKIGQASAGWGVFSWLWGVTLCAPSGIAVPLVRGFKFEYS